MKTILTAAATLIALSAPAFAEGDAAKGEKEFKRCKACHTIDEGGANKTGPNLYGVVGRAPGAVAEFGYSSDLLAYAENNPDLVWDAETLAGYIPNPSEFIGGKSKMTAQRVKKMEDLIAYLDSVDN
jgi:cytochrome c